MIASLLVFVSSVHVIKSLPISCNVMTVVTKERFNSSSVDKFYLKESNRMMMIIIIIIII